MTPHSSEPSPQETPPAYPTIPKKESNPFYVFVLGTTIAAGGTTVITGLLALSEQSKAEDNCLADRNWCKSQGGRDAAANAQTLSIVSTTAFVIGAIGIVTLFIVPSKKTAAAAKASASGFLLEGTF
jgi:hypothetical protein